MSLPYPLTITPARYSGVYEGGKWCAFHSDAEAIPSDSHGDDSEAASWWAMNKDRVGLGGNPEEAIADLQAKMEANPAFYTPWSTRWSFSFERKPLPDGLIRIDGKVWRVERLETFTATDPIPSVHYRLVPVDDPE